jgi:hypothetical protein
MSAAALPSFASGLQEMNGSIVLEWLSTRGVKYPLVLVWFIVLMVLSATLALNVFACLWKGLVRTRNRSGLRFWVFWSVHLLIGLVMLLHGLDMVVGKKYGPIHVQAGDEVPLDHGWSLQVHEVMYVDDPELLQLKGHQARQAMTRDRFDMQANAVRVSLARNGRQVSTGQTKMLQPLIHENMHIVLRGFSGQGHSTSARIKVVNAPLHRLFFVSYALLIASLAVWFIVNLFRPVPLNSTSSAFKDTTLNPGQ